MANLVANSLDWYINKLNTMHLMPVNAATLLRDISAKQFGDNNFTPRPLTMDNFTNAELDALYQLAQNPETGKYSHITDDSYDRVTNKSGNKWYGEGNLDLGKYFSPLRSVSTTLGQATVSGNGDNKSIKDKYDFNTGFTGGIKLFDMGNGEVAWRGQDGELYKGTQDDFLNFGLKWSRKNDGLYGRLRQHAAELGHADRDPDSQKIRTDIRIKDIKDRLGGGLYTHDVHKPMSKGRFILNGIGVGALTGAPIGAVLGAISGAIRLIDKNKRKNWLKTMLTHVLGGAAIAGAVGATGSGLAHGYVFNRFEKNSSAKKYVSDEVDRPKPENGTRSKLIKVLSYLVPAAALAGAGVYAYGNFDKLVSKALGELNGLKYRDYNFEWVPSMDML